MINTEKNIVELLNEYDDMGIELLNNASFSVDDNSFTDFVENYVNLTGQMKVEINSAISEGKVNVMYGKVRNLSSDFIVVDKNIDFSDVNLSETMVSIVPELKKTEAYKRGMTETLFQYYLVETNPIIIDPFRKNVDRYNSFNPDTEISNNTAEFSLNDSRQSPSVPRILSGKNGVPVFYNSETDTLVLIRKNYQNGYNMVKLHNQSRVNYDTLGNLLDPQPMCKACKTPEFGGNGFENLVLQRIRF